MGMNPSVSISFSTKHISYSKKGVQSMKAHSNNDKTLDELGTFVSRLRASSLGAGGREHPQESLPAG